MSVQSIGAAVPQRIVGAWETRATGLVAIASGAAVLAAVGAASLCLISWSVADPSLTHATSGETRNLLGPLGAIVSDLVMQMLGMAGVLLLLPIAFWGLELVSRQHIDRIKGRLVIAPLAVVFIAASLSSLPVPQSWPLRHGLGGILGDLSLGAVVGVLALANADKATAAAGLFFFAGGMMLLMSSLGLSSNDLGAALPRRRAVGPAREPHGPDRSAAKAGGDPSRARLFVGDRDPGVATSGAPDDWHDHEPYAEQRPAIEAPASRYAFASAVRPSAAAVQPPQPSFDDTERYEPGFEQHTEAGSRAIAERFAPAPAEPVRRLFQRAPEPAATVAPVPEKAGFLRTFSGFRRPETGYKRPSLNLLKRGTGTPPGAEFTQSALRGNARLLEDVLRDFGVAGKVHEIKPGPVVTLYEFEPARGIKSSRVIGLADDIARSMSATAVRVAAIPGRNVLGIELPNVRRETVYLRELLEEPAYRTTDARLPIVLGRAIGGEPVIADLARMPHLLVAGTTGSGKSVGVNAMILSLLYRLGPDECRLLMIDPKMLELSVYNGIPHLLAPVVTDPLKAVAALNWAVVEMEERYKRMAQLAVRNIEVFNNRVRHAKKSGEPLTRTVQTGFDRSSGQAIYEHEHFVLEPMPYIVVVVDEFADLMIAAGKEIEAAVQRLAQMARAAGIHIVMATQRPSVDVVTGTIKANFPTRISFKVASKIDSRTILNDTGAEQLLGQGDMLYAAGDGQTLRVHGPFVADDEVEAIVGHLRGQGEVRYIAGITELPVVVEPAPVAPRAIAEATDDDVYDRAVAIVIRDRKASTSYVQRRLSIGYNRAADLIERMQRDGIVGPPDRAGRRAILDGSDAPGAL